VNWPLTQLVHGIVLAGPNEIEDCVDIFSCSKKEDVAPPVWASRLVGVVDIQKSSFSVKRLFPQVGSEFQNFTSFIEQRDYGEPALPD